MMVSDEGAKLRKKAASIDRILTREYGRKLVEADEDPLDTLIETILSQNTTDVNSHRAFKALKKRYPTWSRLIGEDPKRVAAIIRSGGLAGIKAERILAALEHIKRETGALSLDFLRDMPAYEADAWLGRMKGVGPKTRSIVLLFSLGMPAFPVDTHIHRVAKRLGLIGRKTSREQAQIEMASLVPSSEFYNFHINMIEHGRAVCKARTPICDVCKVSGLCDYFSTTRKAQT
jgi:endonuclease-3